MRLTGLAFHHRMLTSRRRRRTLRTDDKADVFFFAENTHPNLEPDREIHLVDIEIVDGIDLRNITAAASGAELIVDAAGVAIAERPNKIAGERVSGGHVNAL